MGHVSGSQDRTKEDHRQASAELLPLVYDELRRLARSYMAQERAGQQTLQATALVHEAYLRLLGTDDAALKWDGRAHFFAAAAEAMRRILIERARRRLTLRHGGAVDRVRLGDLAEDDVPAVACPMAGMDDLLALDTAFTQFAQVDPDNAELVKLLCFGGLSLEEAAAIRGMSRATAHRRWVYARAWLRAAVDGQAGGAFQI
jgi:RNA polymerase sigma factor (TIGR02999 family)